MRPEDLDVALRPRSSWEAMELGTALLRRHAGAIWRPWLLATLPVLALLSALAWWLDLFWVAAIVLWWLKPVFDRIPLYVLSRGVFGRTPTAGETLRAQWSFGRAALPGYLLWRRLSPVRSLLMPVDMLEGSVGAQRRMRRRVVGGPAYAQATLLTWISWHFELALTLGVVATVFIAIPSEALPDSLRSFWTLLAGGPPPWLQLALNLASWLAMSVVGPFYVAAGFGLYLNRRTETEAWDVELAFRRLRERLHAQAAASLVVALLACAWLLPLPAQAQRGAPVQQDAATQPQSQDEAEDDKAASAQPLTGDETDAETPQTLEQVFGAERVDDSRFRKAVAEAYEDPLLGGERTVVEWVPRNRTQTDRERPDLSGLAGWVSMIAEWGLWIVAGALLLAIVLTAPRWMPWLRGSARRARADTPAPESMPLPLPDTLPDDIATVARRLWQQGHHRDALALLYRGSVEAMARQAGVELPPGATEAQCLRAARKLPLAAARDLFARIVRVWQYAAYGGRLPEADEFDELVDAAGLQWEWRR